MILMIKNSEFYFSYSIVLLKIKFYWSILGLYDHCIWSVLFKENNSTEILEWSLFCIKVSKLWVLVKRL